MLIKKIAKKPAFFFQACVMVNKFFLLTPFVNGTTNANKACKLKPMENGAVNK